MKTIPPFAGSRLTMAACLLLWGGSAEAANPYSEQTHGPRIGTRILHFFKDLAYGENPNERYQNQRRQQPPPPQYRQSPGHSGGQRYSLDRPAAPSQRVMPPSQPPVHVNRPPAPAQHPPAPAPDLPYASPENGRSPEAGVGSQREDLPPVTIKPKTNTTQKTSPPTVAKNSPVTVPPKQDSKPQPVGDEVIPTTSSLADSVSSVSTSTSQKSWQSPASQASSAPQQVEQKPATTASSDGNTLTGSKTGKDGRVKSPYPPHNELDVTGLPTGSLAMDPTTGKVFRVP